MALDAGLLATANVVLARRYTWTPCALSVGKFQRIKPVRPMPFDVVRRPSGGRAVLHGESFEWSFAVAFPQMPPGSDIAIPPEAPYRLVATALRRALERMGVVVECGEGGAYQRSSWCFASALRHDLIANGHKVAAIAQARMGGRVLVHGSVLERRPPLALLEAAEDLLGERWMGEGLAGASVELPRTAVWRELLRGLETALREVNGTANRGAGSAAWSVRR